MRIQAILVILLWTALHVQAGHDGTDWSQAEAVPVVEGAQFPADIAVAPDGSLWFIEAYSGDVLVLDEGKVEVVHHVDVVAEQDERGLVGLALTPDHEETGAYYLYYTAPNDEDGENRLVRVQEGQEQSILTVPAAPEHNGGRIALDEAGNLFVSTGENQLRDPAQDDTSLLGKILHLTPDGRPVEGNLEGLVYSKGHRNPYGLAYDEETKRLWSTENSGWRRDEVNVIEAGANYGYPECEGRGLNGVDTPCPTDKGYTFPALSFYEDRAVAPTGAAFWNGGFYWGSLREGSIHHTWQEDGVWQDAIVHERGPAEALLDVETAPDGTLWFSTVSGIFRLAWPEGALPADHDSAGTTTSGTEAPPLEGPVTRDPDAPTRGIPNPGPAGAPGPGLAWLVAALAVGAVLAGRRSAR